MANPAIRGGQTARNAIACEHPVVARPLEQTVGVQTISVVELLVDVLSGVEAAEDSEGFYSRLAEAVCGLAGMRRAVIFRYDEELRRVRAAGSHGVPLERFSGCEVNVETAPVAAQALAEDRVIEVIPPQEHEIAE